MDAFVIEGGARLKGTVKISGSKNAALPILLSAPLVSGQVEYSNVPDLRDIRTTMRLLNILGCEVSFDNNRAVVRPDKLSIEAPYDLVKTMRASVLCLGPLLARLGEAKVALPGGCAIGARPVDQHLKAFEQMGASFDLDSGYIHGTCNGRLKGAHVRFDFPTVGGTENALMGAVLAEGETILDNAAREPEVQDLANFLNAAGAKITGHGTGVIRIQGVDELKSCEYSIMPDRIEAGTYLCAAAITDGELLLEGCPTVELDAVINKLMEMGVSVERVNGVVAAGRGEKFKCVDVVTLPYPGFPTDMQAQIMALMTLAEGSGVIKETIFENRFMHVSELLRMGANIKLSGNSAVIRGVDSLKGAPVMASDLRASASLVVAGLAAKGVTEVSRIYHLDRGYESMEKKLEAVGARVKRVSK